MGEVRQKCQRGVRSISAKFGHLHKIEQPIVMIVMMIIIASCQIDITMTMRQKSIEKIKRQLAEGSRLLQGGNFRRTFVQKGTLASSGIFSTRDFFLENANQTTACTTICIAIGQGYFGLNREGGSGV